MKSENSTLAVRLVVFAAGMFAFGVFAMPPLYDVFCEITGFGGRTNAAAQAAEEAPDLAREVRIEFVATVNNYAPWEFVPAIDSMTTRGLVSS